MKTPCCGCIQSQTSGQIAEKIISTYFGDGAGKLANLIVSTIFCSRNLNLTTKSLVAIPTAVIYFYSDLWSTPSANIPYKPFALSVQSLSLSINTFNNATKIKGSNQSDLIFSHQEGSEVFAIGGLNYLVANEGKDTFYFSLCSTDIIDNKVSVIQNFNESQDQISFFCTKAIIHPENITILHEIVEGTDITYVHVMGNEKNSSIALIGNFELNSTDIILNEKWPYT